MTTYWLLGEKEPVSSGSGTIAPCSSQPIEESELEATPEISFCVTNDQNKSSTFEKAPTADPSRKARFSEDALDTVDADNTNSNNCSSKSVGPSQSRLKQSHPSQHPLQSSTHIIANPMTSVIVGSNDDNGQQTSTLASVSESSQQSTSPFRY